VRVAALLAALVIVAGSFQISRPGYSVDEEFTEFAVRGIQAHGLPLLPSGLLYDRGIAYSYAATVVNGRVVSLASAALSVLLVFVLVRRVTNATSALVAAVLVASSVPFWATATTARFYAPFLLVSLGFLICLTHRSYWIPMFVLAFLARLTHELGFTIAVVPLVCLLMAAGDRRHWLKATVVTIAGLAAGQVLLFALHALEPASGETMVRRFFLWQVLNLFERPGDRQFGIPLVVMVVAWVLAERYRWLWTVASLSIATAIFSFSMAQATNSAPLSLDLIGTVLRDGSRYPLDMFWHIAGTIPLTMVVALAGLATRAAGYWGPWRPAERAAHLLWIGWIVWFGVIESGITTNYLLLPVSFMLMAIAIDVGAIGRTIGRTRVLPYVSKGSDTAVVGADSSPPVVLGIALVVAAVALDQWRGDGSLLDRLERARPTIHVAGIDEIRESLQPADRVVCTDELGCLMLVGRIERWLALDDFVRERFLVRRAEGSLTGVYTGVPAVLRPADVFSLNPDGTLPDRVLIVDIFKDYPIGNSRDWLVRAIEEDGLQVVPLLETPQARVLAVSPPERVARRLAQSGHTRPSARRSRK
jgi:hypothetical protein